MNGKTKPAAPAHKRTPNKIMKKKLTKLHATQSNIVLMCMFVKTHALAGTHTYIHTGFCISALWCLLNTAQRATQAVIIAVKLWPARAASRSQPQSANESATRRAAPLHSHSTLWHACLQLGRVLARVGPKFM